MASNKTRACLMAGACEASVYLGNTASRTEQGYKDDMNDKVYWRCPKRSGSYASLSSHCEREWTESL